LWLHVIAPLLILGVALLWLLPALLRKQLRLVQILLVAALVLAYVIHSYGWRERRGTPERAAQDFLIAIKEFDCDRAWGYFSEDSQRAVETASEKFKHDPVQKDMMRLQPELYKNYLEPKNLYCKYRPVFGEYRPMTVKLITATDSSATIGVKRAIATEFLIPGFWPTSFSYEDRQMQLIREGKEWKISFRP
jgi:hypothetical protein